MAEKSDRPDDGDLSESSIEQHPSAQDNEKPKTKTKRREKGSLASALGISTLIHAGAFAAISYLSQDSLPAKGTISGSPSKPQIIKPKPPDVEISSLDVKILTEQEFEQLVAKKIALAKFYDNEKEKNSEVKKKQLLSELVQIFEKRIKGYAEELFEDLKKDSKYDAKYAEFLIKTAAYHRSLENFREGKIDWLKASTLESHWQQALGKFQESLLGVSENADELTKINAIQRAIFLRQVLEKYKGKNERFDVALLENKSNCSGISDMSMAAVEELLHTDRYRFYGHVDHTKTVYVTKGGRKFLFENTSVDNQGKRLKHDDKGLDYPKEAMIMAYLISQHGYELEQFPEDLQHYWQQKAGNAVGGGNTDSLFGARPSKGYCSDGALECFFDTETEHDFKEELKRKIQEKSQKIEEMSLAEILDGDFFVVEGDVNVKPEEEDAIGLSIINMRFMIDPDKLRKEFRARFGDMRGRELYDLSLAQLRKLRQFALFAGVYQEQAIDDELIHVVIPGAVKQMTQEKAIAQILVMEDATKMVQAVSDFAREYHTFPLPLARKLVNTPGLGAFELSAISIHIEELDFETFKLLVDFGQKVGGTLNLNLNQVTSEMLDYILSRPDKDWISLRFNNAIISDPVVAKKLASIQTARMAIANIASMEAAQAFANPNIREYLKITNPKFSSPEIAGILTNNITTSQLGSGLIFQKAEQLTIGDVTQIVANNNGRGVVLDYNDNPMPTEHARAFKAARGNIGINISHLNNVEVINLLGNSSATWIGINNIETVSEDVLKEAVKFRSKMRLQSLGSSSKTNLQIKKYFPPSQAEILAAETAATQTPPDYDTADNFQRDYKRVTSKMMGGSSFDTAVGSNSIELVTIDPETAKAFKDKINNYYPANSPYWQNLNISFVVLDLPDDSARYVAETSGVYHISILGEVSPKAIREIVEAKKNKHLNLRLDDITEDHAEELAKHNNDLSLHIPDFSTQLSRPFRNFQGETLELLLTEPLDVEAAKNIIQAPHLTRIFLTSIDDSKSAITEEAAKILVNSHIPITPQNTATQVILNKAKSKPASN